MGSVRTRIHIETEELVGALRDHIVGDNGRIDPVIKSVIRAVYKLCCNKLEAVYTFLIDPDAAGYHDVNAGYLEIFSIFSLIKNIQFFISQQISRHDLPGEKIAQTLSSHLGDRFSNFITSLTAVSAEDAEEINTIKIFHDHFKSKNHFREELLVEVKEQISMQRLSARIPPIHPRGLRTSFYPQLVQVVELQKRHKTDRSIMSKLTLRYQWNSARSQLATAIEKEAKKMTAEVNETIDLFLKTSEFSNEKHTHVIRQNPVAFYSLAQYYLHFKTHLQQSQKNSDYSKKKQKNMESCKEKISDLVRKLS